MINIKNIKSKEYKKGEDAHVHEHMCHLFAITPNDRVLRVLANKICQP